MRSGRSWWGSLSGRGRRDRAAGDRRWHPLRSRWADMRCTLRRRRSIRPRLERSRRLCRRRRRGMRDRRRRLRGRRCSVRNGLGGGRIWCRGARRHRCLNRGRLLNRTGRCRGHAVLRRSCGCGGWLRCPWRLRRRCGRNARCSRSLRRRRGFRILFRRTLRKPHCRGGVERRGFIRDAAGRNPRLGHL